MTGGSDATVVQAGAGDAIVALTSIDARRVEHRAKRRGRRFYIPTQVILLRTAQ